MLKRFKDKRVDADWLHTNFPCMMACPAHTNAGRYVGLIAEGRFEEAYRLAREPNPLASICGSADFLLNRSGSSHWIFGCSNGPSDHYVSCAISRR